MNSDVGISLPIHHPILQFTLLATMTLLVQLTVKRLHLPGLIGLILGGIGCPDWNASLCFSTTLRMHATRIGTVP